MPKTHTIGKQHFVQILSNFKVLWNGKLYVRGDTHEIEPPFRHAKPLIIRLPFNSALVVGKWAGVYDDEETALNFAMHGRVLKDEDFQEGWTPPAYQAPKESSEHWDI